MILRQHLHAEPAVAASCLPPRPPGAEEIRAANLGLSAPARPQA